MPPKPLIVVDENIPLGVEAFNTIGRVKTLAGRAITNEVLKEAGVLCVRSVTKVNADLLDGTPVRVVATATIGFDHVDRDYLDSRTIGFASAPGSNANSVAEYVLAALLVLAQKFGFDLRSKTLGIVGVGNVGGRVEAYAFALGMKIIVSDPPLARQIGEVRFRPLDELLAKSDIITLHVPLTDSGQDATRHLLNKETLSGIKRGAILLNTSRGPVVDPAALADALQTERLKAAVLDVWENEPAIDPELVKLVAIATPHIAGYSYDGKINGTMAIYRKVCDFIGASASFKPLPYMPAPPVPVLDLAESSRRESVQDTLRRAVLGVYDIMKDDADLRKIANEQPEERGTYFDLLRKNYPQRREFSNTEVVLPADSESARILSKLRFKVKTGARA